MGFRVRAGCRALGFEGEGFRFRVSGFQGAGIGFRGLGKRALGITPQDHPKKLFQMVESADQARGCQSIYICLGEHLPPESVSGVGICGSSA